MVLGVVFVQSGLEGWVFRFLHNERPQSVPGPLAHSLAILMLLAALKGSEKTEGLASGLRIFEHF